LQARRSRKGRRRCRLKIHIWEPRSSVWWARRCRCIAGAAWTRQKKGRKRGGDVCESVELSGGRNALRIQQAVPRCAEVEGRSRGVRHLRASDDDARRAHARVWGCRNATLYLCLRLFERRGGSSCRDRSVFVVCRGRASTLGPTTSKRVCQECVLRRGRHTGFAWPCFERITIRGPRSR